MDHTPYSRLQVKSHVFELPLTLRTTYEPSLHVVEQDSESFLVVSNGDKVSASLLVLRKYAPTSESHPFWTNRNLGPFSGR